jgi:ABC-2 type transport system permease protein
VGGPLWAGVLILLGTAAFSGLGLLMAGALRAEATLAGANLVYLVMLALGGVVLPLSTYPSGLRPVLEFLPLGAFTDGMRSVLADGGGAPWTAVCVLAGWAVVSLTLAARTFRWE